MIENFEQMFEESLGKVDMRPGAIVSAQIVDIRPDRVIVNAGLKTESPIAINEFRGEDIKVGDSVEVVVVAIDNHFGETRLSYEKARQARSWKLLEKIHTSGEIIMGIIVERVKGGFTVDVKGVKAFLPGSLVDVKPVRDPGYLEGKELEFKIIKMDQRRNNVVVSRRAVMEAENSAERSARLEELQEGQQVKGIVKNITDYGAFVDLGGVDGLLHITDMAWKRVKHPSELVNVGDELEVKILKFDRDKNRVSLGLKQLGEDPWENIARRYPATTRLFGRITNITDYGCFVEIEEGVEGLVHMSEMDWTNKNIHPSKVVKSGDEVEVVVLEIDEERRRISLGIKQCKPNPWQDFSEKHQKDEKISGKIRSITDFGMFIGLDGDIDGLVHLSDISWTEAGEEAVRQYKKGDEVEAVILAIDPERERISLGIKQLQPNPLGDFIDSRNKDEVIEVEVIDVEQKSANVKINDDLAAVLRIADYSYDRIKDLREEIQPGEKIEVKVLGIDKKSGQLQVSRKALETRASDGSVSRTSGDEMKTTLGDLLKQQMQGEDKE